MLHFIISILFHVLVQLVTFYRELLSALKGGDRSDLLQ